MATEGGELRSMTAGGGKRLIVSERRRGDTTTNNCVLLPIFLGYGISFLGNSEERIQTQVKFPFGI